MPKSGDLNSFVLLGNVAFSGLITSVPAATFHSSRGIPRSSEKSELKRGRLMAAFTVSEIVRAKGSRTVMTTPAT